MTILGKQLILNETRIDNIKLLALTKWTIPATIMYFNRLFEVV